MTAMAKISLAALLLALGAIAGVLAAEQWLFAPRLDRASSEISELKTGNARLLENLAANNVAIKAHKRAMAQLEASAASAQAKMETALTAARQSAKNHYSSANAILASSTNGQNSCESARIAFDDELRKERAQ